MSDNMNNLGDNNEVNSGFEDPTMKPAEEPVTPTEPDVPTEPMTPVEPVTPVTPEPVVEEVAEPTVETYEADPTPPEVLEPVVEEQTLVAPTPTVPPAPTMDSADTGVYTGPVNPAPADQTQYGSGTIPAGPETTDGLAIAALVVGILGAILSCCIPVIGFLPAIGAIVMGIISIRKNKHKATYLGKGLAIAGIVLGGLGLVITVLMVIASAFFFANMDLQELYDINY